MIIALERRERAARRGDSDIIFFIFFCSDRPCKSVFDLYFVVTADEEDGEGDPLIGASRWQPGALPRTASKVGILSVIVRYQFIAMHGASLGRFVSIFADTSYARIDGSNENAVRHHQPIYRYFR
jgi:hypothetical protein